MSLNAPTKDLARLTISDKPASTPTTDDLSPPQLIADKYFDVSKGREIKDEHLDQREIWRSDHYKSFKKLVGQNSDDAKMTRRGFAKPENNQQFRVWTNYFTMDFNPDDENHSENELYIYEVNGIPDSAARPKKRALMRKMIDQCPILYDQEDFFVDDGIKKIVSCKDLSLYDREDESRAEIGETLATIEVDDNDARADDGQARKISLSLDYSKCLSYDDMNNYVGGYAESVSFLDDGLIEAVNLIVNKSIQHYSGDLCFPLGTNKIFAKHGQKSLRAEGKAAVRGYNFSYRSGMGCHLLNVNTAMSVFHEPMTVAAYLKLGDTRQMKKHLIGVRVWLNFERTEKSSRDRSLDARKRRIKIIAAFGNKSASEQIAYDKVTVLEHMRNSYGTKPTGKAHSVCVNLGGTASGKELWYMAEDLRILPYQQFRGDLSGSVTQKLIKVACRTPEDNLHSIAEEFTSFLNNQGATGDKNATAEMPEFLTDFGINIYPQLLTVPAYLAKSPPISYGNTTIVPREGKWKLVKETFLSPGTFKGPAYFLIPGPNSESERDIRDMMSESDIENYLRCFHDQYHANGITGLGTFNQLDDSNHTILPNFAPRTFEAALTKARNQKAGLVVLLLPTSNKTYVKHYALFKKICDQNLGINSLCLCEEKISRCFSNDNNRVRPNVDQNHPFAGYVRNVAMKLNVRLGHSNHRVEDLAKQIPNSKNERIMVLGADVVHPGGKSHGGTPSIAAVVGTIDDSLVSYRGSARYQTGLEEIISHMYTMVLERIEAYKSKNGGRVPTSIVYYRDGVDEGKFSRVLDEEVRDIHLAWSDASKNTAQANSKLKITTIIVTKRHNTRFYPKSKFKINNGNCTPGTIVDSGVTMPYHFDFYLLSQNSIQGTGRPAHYIVLRNDMDFSADQIQNFTNMLCYTYVRSTTSVSYAPPAYYADHLCERVKQYLLPLYDGDEAYKDFNEDDVALEANTLWGEGGRPNGNPWKVALDDTMFWM